MRHLVAVLTVIATPAVAQVSHSAECAAAAAPATAQPARIPIEVYSNHVYVRVCAGDRPLDFILDTGASETFLDMHTAVSLGLKLGSSFTNVGAGAGSNLGARLDGASVRLAGSSLVQGVWGAIDLSRMPPRELHRVDGILGSDFIARFVIAIDYVKQELRLYDARTFRYSGPGASIPVTLIENQPYIEAAVRLADGTTLKGQMIIDVGSGGSLALNTPFVEENHLRDRVGPTIHRRIGAGVGGPLTADIGRVAALKLGSLELARPITSLQDGGGGNMSGNDRIGNIGGEILRRFTVLFDYTNRRMILEPHAKTSEPFEFDMAGLSLLMDSNLTSAVIDRVIPGSPAADAGLVAGDTLVSIDGKPADGAAVRRLRGRLRRDGERIVLEVRRAGDVKTVTLVLRRLV